MDNNSNKNFLYCKRTTFIPPRSSAIIQLKPSQSSLSSLPDEVIIAPDELFDSRKLVHSSPLALSKKDFLLTTITNFYDSGITTKKNQIVAKTISQSTSFIISINRFQRKLNYNDPSTKPPSERQHHPPNLDKADMAHFSIPPSERRTYLLEKLQLDKNPLLQIEKRSSKLLEILAKHWNCFDFHGNRIPKCKSDVTHHISTGPSAPIKSKCRPLNPIIAAKVKDKLDDLEKRGVIRKSSSPWASPILIVLKKDNDFRLVADYRRLNKEIIGNA